MAFIRLLLLCSRQTDRPTVLARGPAVEKRDSERGGQAGYANELHLQELTTSVGAFQARQEQMQCYIPLVRLCVRVCALSMEQGEEGKKSRLCSPVRGY